MSMHALKHPSIGKCAKSGVYIYVCLYSICMYVYACSCVLCEVLCRHTVLGYAQTDMYFGVIT